MYEDSPFKQLVFPVVECLLFLLSIVTILNLNGFMPAQIQMSTGQLNIFNTFTWKKGNAKFVHYFYF